MKNIKINNNSKNPINITVGEYELNIFRVGNSPRLEKHPKTMEDHKRIKGIHTHFTYEVFFITSGTLSLETEHYTKEYTSSVLIIPPKLKHYSIPGEGESYCLLFSFVGNVTIEELLNETVCKLPMSEEIAFYIKKFTEKSIQNTNSAEEDVRHLSALIFNKLISELKTKKTDELSKKNLNSRHINEIEAFINNNIKKNKITLSDVAAAVFLSTKQISRIIEKEYGMSFSELITEKRLAVAAALLKNTDMKISEVAAQSFYGTETYFYTKFKSKYGMSPLKYRKEIQISLGQVQKISKVNKY